MWIYHIGYVAGSLLFDESGCFAFWKLFFGICQVLRETHERSMTTRQTIQRSMGPWEMMNIQLRSTQWVKILSHCNEHAEHAFIEMMHDRFSLRHQRLP